MRPGRPRQGERGGVAPCMHSDRPTHIRTITSSHQPHAPAASYLGSRIQLTAFARNQHQRKRWTTRNEPALLQTQCTPRVLSVVHQHRCRDPGHLCTVRTLDRAVKPGHRARHATCFRSAPRSAARRNPTHPTGQRRGLDPRFSWSLASAGPLATLHPSRVIVERRPPLRALKDASGAAFFRGGAWDERGCGARW
jgi:hypothetical protein